MVLSEKSEKETVHQSASILKQSAESWLLTPKAFLNQVKNGRLKTTVY